MKTKVIVIANRKGGVGKTTIAYNLIHALVLAGRRVCGIDLDSQGNLTKRVEAQVTVLEDFRAGKKQRTVAGFDFVGATKQFAQLEAELNELFDRNMWFREEWMKTLLTGVEYDFVVIDTPPSLSLMTVNAFCVADKVLIPVNADDLSLDGLSETKKILGQVTKSNPKLKYHSVFNMFTKGLVMSQQVMAAIQGDPGWSGIQIPDRQRVLKDNMLHRPAFDDPDVKRAFEKLTEVVNG